MTSYIVYRNETIELNDRDFVPEVGEKLYISSKGDKISVTVTNIEKIFLKEGNSVDLLIKIYLS